MSTQSLATFCFDTVIATARNAEYPNGDDPLTDKPGDGTFADPALGCNRVGSCAPGIGINTGEVLYLAGTDQLTRGAPESWTILDQGAGVDAQPTPLARDPQDSQHIGGDPDGAIVNRPGSGGSEALTDVVVINAHSKSGTTLDQDDSLTLEIAVAQAAPGIGIGAANADPLNRTNETVEIGDAIWGTNTLP